MFDHAFMAAIEAMRQSFGDALLDGQVGEDRLHIDILAGDMTWETSYALPGEDKPPRVRADLTLDWPTWSQTAVRSWTLGDIEEQPELVIELVFRIQELAGAPDLGAIRRQLPEEGPELGGEPLRRATPIVEQGFDRELTPARWTVEFTYEASYEFTEGVLSDLTGLTKVFSSLGPWVASTLVRLGDLQLAFLPPGEYQDDDDL